MPEVIKIAIAPYIIYLVYKRDPVYLPALIVFVTPGTTITYAVLFSTMILSISSFKEIKKYGLKWVFLLTLLPAVIFLYISLQRLLVMGEGLVAILTPLDYYLGIFPFFYGVLIAKKISRNSINGILIALFIMPLLSQFGIVNFSIRIYWISYPVFMIIFLGSLIYIIQKKAVNQNWFFLSFLFLLFNLSPKFTVLFSGIISLIIFYFKAYQRKILLKIFTSWRIVIVFLVVIFLVISNAEKAIESLSIQDLNSTESSYYGSWSSFKEQLYFKAFGDRAPIWLGGWNIIIEQKEFYFYPPTKPFVYTMQSLTGSEISENEIPIHNLLLELMRNYGFLYGLWLFILFIYFCIIGAGKFIWGMKENNVLLLSLSAGTLGSALVGSLVGQYPLMGTFSISMITFLGIFFALNFNQMKIEKI